MNMSKKSPAQQAEDRFILMQHRWWLHFCKRWDLRLHAFDHLGSQYCPVPYAAVSYGEGPQFNLPLAFAEAMEDSFL